MHFSEAQIAAAHATLAHEGPQIEKLVDETLRQLATVSDISQKKALVSIITSWIAGSMQGDEDEAQQLLRSICDDLPAFVTWYCQQYREEADRRLAACPAVGRG